MNQLEEIKIVEETGQYIKILVNNLSVIKLINFIIDQGNKEEYHLVEMELLLFTLKEINITKDKIGKDIYKTISDFLLNERYMDFHLDSTDILKKVKDLRVLVTDKMVINGEIHALKNTPHSEFKLKVSIL